MIPTNVLTKLWIIFSHCFYSSEAKQSCDSCIEHFSNETKLWFNLCFLPTETFARTWEMLLVKAQCLKQLQCLVRWRMCLWWNWARLKLQICRSGSRHSGPQNLTRWIVACGVSAIHPTFFAAAAVEAIKDIIVDPDVRCAEQYFGWNQKIQAAHVEDDLASLGRPQIARFAHIFVAGKEERQIGLSRHICRGLSGAWPPRAEQIVCDWVDKEGAKGLLGCLWRENFLTCDHRWHCKAENIDLVDDSLFWHKTIFNADHYLLPERHGFRWIGTQVVKGAGSDSLLQESTAVHQVQSWEVTKSTRCLLHLTISPRKAGSALFQ